MATPQEHNDRADALTILLRLREAGHIAYFAGGCVRDTILGLIPDDWDVATDAPPPRVREIFPNTQAVGAAFGVILVRHHGSMIEVATFRTDLAYTDGRRPQGIQFTTAEADAKRRDFTINGLFLDPVENRIIDYVDGQADLKTKTLRAIGNPNERFAEDHLRLLRAVRFAARFDLQIEPITTAAIIASAHKLPRISPERIADELRRMLTAPTRNRAWNLLSDLSLTPQLFRNFPSETPVNFTNSKSIFAELQPPTPSFGLALAAATLDYQWHQAKQPTDVRPLLDKSEISKAVRTMRATLKLSNEEGDDLRGTFTGAALLLTDPPIDIAQTKRFLATPTATNTRALLNAIASVGLHINRINQLNAQLSELEKTDYAPTPFITGDDLTKAGLNPGPKFKLALDTAYDAQLEGKITNKSEALALAISKASTPNT